MTRAPLLGVNLPWFAGAYGHDLAENLAHPGWPAEATAAGIRGTLACCRELGFDAVRFWVCEHGEGVLHERGEPRGVMPALLEALDLVQDAAAAYGLRLYPSLFDANSYHRDGDPLLERTVRDADARARLAEHVVAPIARRLDPSLTFAVEALNEPEQMTPEGAGSRGLPWRDVAALLAACRDAVRAERPGLPVTASAQHGILPALVTAAPFLDLVDLHRYCDSGSLPPLPDLGLPPGAPPVIAGECGTRTAPTDGDDDAISHFVWNAARWGYGALFLWRLEGTHGLVGPDGAPRARFDRTRTALAEVRSGWRP